MCPTAVEGGAAREFRVADVGRTLENAKSARAARTHSTAAEARIMVRIEVKFLTLPAQEVKPIKTKLNFETW